MTPSCPYSLMLQHRECIFISCGASQPCSCIFEETNLSSDCEIRRCNKSEHFSCDIISGWSVGFGEWLKNVLSHKNDFSSFFFSWRRTPNSKFQEASLSLSSDKAWWNVLLHFLLFISRFNDKIELFWCFLPSSNKMYYVLWCIFSSMRTPLI